MKNRKEILQKKLKQKYVNLTNEEKLELIFKSKQKQSKIKKTNEKLDEEFEKCGDIHENRTILAFTLLGLIPSSIAFAVEKSANKAYLALSTAIASACFLGGIEFLCAPIERLVSKTLDKQANKLEIAQNVLKSNSVNNDKLM